MFTSSQLVSAFRECGLEKGSIVHIQGNLRRIGQVDTQQDRDHILEFYYHALRKVIGDEGTVTVLTPFFDYGRYGTPFIHEETPSQGGVFSEYIRTRPGAIRSLHPLFSITGLGPEAEKICGGPHFCSHGWRSPWTELYRRNAVILSLGLGLKAGGTTFMHYIENMYGVPYQYTRLLTMPVYSEGKEVRKPFMAPVRYLDYGIKYDTESIKRRLVDMGLAGLVPFGTSESFFSDAKGMLDACCQFLDDDPYCFLASPPAFRPGEMPLSNDTGEMRLVYGREG